MPLPNDDSSSFLPLSNELKRATYISMSRLAEIINYKRQEISPWIAHTNDWKRRAGEHRNFRGFRTALDLAPFGFIAEVKRASPSAGVITEQFDPLSIATKSPGRSWPHQKMARSLEQAGPPAGSIPAKKCRRLRN